MGELKKNMTEAEKLTASATREMQSAWLKVGAVYGTVAAAGGLLMKQIAGTAMRTQELGIVLGVVASNAGVTAETTAQLEAEMKDLGMTTQAARTIITRMIQTNVDLSKATDLVRVAQDMAVISMEDSSTAAQGLMRAIVTMNPILLRKYGIMTGLEDIDRRAGEALGILTYETEKSGKVVKKWTREITAAERQQAIFNMILEEGGKFAGTYAGAMEAPGKAMRSFSRYIMEAQEAIGQYWLPVMNAAVGAATSFIKAFIDAPEIVHQLASALLVATTVVAGLTAAIIAKTLALGPLSAAFATASAAAGVFGLSLGVATAGLTLIVTALVLLFQHQQKVKAAFQALEQTTLQTARSYERFVEITMEAARVSRSLLDKIIVLMTSEYALGQQISITRKEFELYQWAVKESEGAVLTLADAQAYLARQLAEEEARLLGHLEVWQQYSVALLYGEELFRRLGIEVGTFAGRLKEAMASAADALTVWDYSIKNSEKYWNTFVASSEKGVVTMRTAFHDLGDEVEFWGEAMESTFIETLSASTEMWEGMQTILKSALKDMRSTVFNYHDNLAEAWDSFNARIESSAVQHQMSMREAEIKYQRSRAELIAKANAEIAAMEAAGLDEKAALRQKKLDEELGMLEYNYEKQKAWAKWHWEIQQLMQEQAHHLRLAELAEFAMKESQIIVSQTQVKLAALTDELKSAAMYSKSRLELMATVALGAAASARAQILSLQAVIDANKAAAKSWEADMAKHLARVDEITAEIQGLIGVGPSLPEMPDFSQWVDDFSSDMSKAAKATKESVVKTLKETMIDIADGFAAAMAIFEEVAEYETPTGLAEGMRVLREDIEMAVKELYQAYETLGKDAIEGAQLFAESAQSVMAMVGDAVEAFSLLKDYGPTMAKDIDNFIDDLEYILIAIRTRLLDLWGWSGARVDTVWGHMETWADAVSAVMSVIGYAVETFNLLREYKGLMPAAIDNLIEDIELVLTKLEEIVPQFEDKGLDAALDFAVVAAAIVEALGGAVSVLAAIADFAPSQAEMRAGIDAFFASLEYFLDEFAWGMWRWEDLASEKTVEIAELLGRTVTALGTAVQPLLDIAEYAPDQATFHSAVNLFFANLEHFLDEFAWGMWRWEDLAGEKPAELAELIGRMLAGLGEAIQPLLDIADYSITPGEAERAAQLFFQSLEIFLDTFAWQAEKFEAKVDPALTALAESIGALVSGIGAAVGPLMELAQYGIVEFEYGGVTFKTLLNLSEVQKSFDLFFLHLGMILADFEEASKEWEVSKAAQALAAAIGELASSLSTALSFLNDVAVYGAETADSAARGFQTFLRDIRRILSDLEEANETMGPALAAAEEFALATADVLSAIQEGINDLNSLGELEEMPDLVEAGISLIKSLEDGMLAQVDEAILTAVGAVQSIVDAIILNCESIWGPQLFAAGVGLGSTLISGMIAGLIAQEGALYSTIASIIQSAIAAANAAAGAVPAGLGGLGGMATPMAVPEFATPTVGAGALGAGPHYHYELEYHAHRAEVGEEDAARAMKLIEFRNRWK